MLVRPTGALETYAEAHPEMDRDFGDMNPDDEAEKDEQDMEGEDHQKGNELNVEKDGTEKDGGMKDMEGTKVKNDQENKDGLGQGMTTENVEIQGGEPK